MCIILTFLSYSCDLFDLSTKDILRAKNGDRKIDEYGNKRMIAYGMHMTFKSAQVNYLYPCKGQQNLFLTSLRRLIY